MESIYALAGLGDSVSDLQARIEAVQAQYTALTNEYWNVRNAHIISTPEASEARARRLANLVEQMDGLANTLNSYQVALASAVAEQQRQAALDAARARPLREATGGGSTTTSSPIWPTTPLVPTGGVTDPAQSVAQQAFSERAGAESFRRAMYLISQPGFDFGMGANRRNAFFNEGRENMSGLGASFDFVEALTTAAKQTAKDYRGADILARAGIVLPTVPAPLKVFVDRAAAALKAQKTRPAQTSEGTVPTGGSVYFPTVTTGGSSWGTYALYAALGVGGYLLIKRLAR